MVLKMTLVLNHSDEVGGTTFYACGHIAYWSGNRGVVVVAPDGAVTIEDIRQGATDLARAIAACDQPEDWEHTPTRDMLPMEEVLHEVMMAHLLVS
jgi:hypothetical protein